MAMNPWKSEDQLSDINVTPLVDVCLVLLIFFLVITPIILYSFSTNLPSVGVAASAFQEEQELIVTLTDDNLIQVEGVTVSEEELVQKIEKFYPPEKTRERKVVFNGGRRASYSKVVQVMDIFKLQGIKNIVIR